MAQTPARRQAPRIAVTNGALTTTSRDIAETFGKPHGDVLKRIRALECSPEFRVGNFSEAPYVHPQNGQTLTEYRITRDGFAFLCMGFTGAKAAQWKEKYIGHFNRMEAALRDRAARKAVAKTEGVRKIVQAPALPAPQAAPGLDARALLLGGQMPPIAMPPELHEAINARAFALASEAAGILREHLARRVPWQHVHGYPSRFLHVAEAIASIQQATLGQCLAHEYANELGHCLASVRAVAQLTQESAQRVQQALAELGPLNAGQQLKASQ